MPTGPNIFFRSVAHGSRFNLASDDKNDLVSYSDLVGSQLNPFNSELECISKVSKEGDPKAPFSIGVGKGATPFPGLLHLTLDTYLYIGEC